MLAVLLLVGSVAGLSRPTPVGDLLQQQGLTRREAESVQFRHRRRNNQALTVAELTDTLAALRSLPGGLQQGHICELLRTTPVETLQAKCATSPDGAWCTYKRTLCDCGANRAGMMENPSLLSIDCEFKPLRFAAVDADGVVYLDRLVEPDVSPAGRSTPPFPSILRCDRGSLLRIKQSELRRSLCQMMEAGTVLLAHTPYSDLRAIGFTTEEMDELSTTGRVVDVAQMGLAEGEQVASLRRMAERHGVAPDGFQAGNSKHCAIQDALVSLSLYNVLRDQVP
jgi:hypothetical protein